MDPNQTLKDLLQNFGQGEAACREDAVDSLCSLADWLKNGGFMPTVESFDIDDGELTTWLIGEQ